MRCLRQKDSQWKIWSTLIPAIGWNLLFISVSSFQPTICTHLICAFIPHCSKKIDSSIALMFGLCVSRSCSDLLCMHRTRLCLTIRSHSSHLLKQASSSAVTMLPPPIQPSPAPLPICLFSFAMLVYFSNLLFLMLLLSLVVVLSSFFVTVILCLLCFFSLNCISVRFCSFVS